MEIKLGSNYYHWQSLKKVTVTEVFPKNKIVIINDGNKSQSIGINRLTSDYFTEECYNSKYNKQLIRDEQEFTLGGYYRNPFVGITVKLLNDSLTNNTVTASLDGKVMIYDRGHFKENFVISKGMTNNLKPSYYNDQEITPFDYIKANKLDFFEGNVIKYVTRHRKKNGKEDIQKAITYLEELLKDYK